MVDLAKGHTAALNKLIIDKGSLLIVNLGTGTGYSVLQMLKVFQQASNKKIPYEIAPRREGDIAECYASTEYAEQHLNWRAEKTLQQMCEDTWNYQNKNTVF